MSMQIKSRIQSTGRWFGALLGIIAFSAALTANADTVRVPAGSVDNLGEAIANAGSGGTVILESGLHQESATVIVGIPVSIVGETGAILEGVTVPNLDEGSPDNIDPVLHILATQDVLVEGIAIQPSEGAIGNTGILIQNAPRTMIRNNSISDHEFGIVVQHGDQVKIIGNLISNMVLFGVVHINGGYAQITRNEINGAGIHGMWLCDANGQCTFNTMSNCGVLGVLLCRFPGETLILPDGSDQGAVTSATRWHVANNSAHHNFIGYVVADGANKNVLVNNGASDNALVDIILDGEYEDPPEPACFENVVALGSQKDVSVWDFGIDNIISGDAVVGP